MFLKSLTLKGFKSFADPATLQLEPGVTVVVGPNGSGKSNVVDAVAWVLGAQGPRTVRSSRMEDVIFAGSADRPALGRAEVSLTIDNRAGRLPGGLAEITITRTLFRSGDSEYAINGQPCRLLDVQELLSDSGVGRQQHVIMGQGQLDHILNARPEDRRAVIEEAAGVLKHRRRRERAERRLAATEENLDRLGDLLREVRRQMRPLERQAAATRSHAVLAEELRALRLHLVGRELAALDDRRTAAGAERDRLRAEEDELRRTMAALDQAADSAAAELSARREEDLVDSLTRVRGLAERCRGLAGVLAERRRSLARALEAAADVDVVSTLEADAARLAAELEIVGAEDAGLAPDRHTLSAAEAALEAAVAEHEAAHGEDGRFRAAEETFAVAQAQLGPLRGALERDQATVARVDERLAALERRRASLRAEADESVRALDELEAMLRDAEPSLADAARRVETSAAALVSAESAFRQAEGLRHRLDARAEALSRAAAESAGVAGAQELAGSDGVWGALMDLVDVEARYAGALEAAFGAAASGVVVDGPAAARLALGRLQQGDVRGTVLAVGAEAADEAAAEELVAVARSALVAAGGGELLRSKVRARRGGLDVLLDRLLAGVVVVADWRQAVDVALAHPRLVAVTPAGDRFAPTGWAMRAGGALATTAAAEQATTEAAAAAARAEEAAGALARARTAADEAARHAHETTRRTERAEERRAVAGRERTRVDAELAIIDDEVAEALRHRAGVAERFERDGAHFADLEDRLVILEAEAHEAGRRLSEARTARRELDERQAEVVAQRRELEVRAGALAERRAVLSSRLAEVERRLAGHVAEREQAGARRRGIEHDITVVDRLAATLEGTATRLDVLLRQLQEQRARQIDEVRAGGARLESLRRQRSECEARLGVSRDRLQALDVELAESGVRREAATEALRRELGCDPEDAVQAPCPELPEGTTAAARAAAVEQELAALGPVNPLALEELGTLEERHRFLEEQVDDVRRARRELQQLIHEVDDEIMRVFTDAFADVNAHFQVLVGTLFPGGTGRLSLSEPEDLLDTGVEVEARPAGKNVRKLSLLSGGERSLVALAFLFAVFRSRPSPFYLMDEVEAALDDVNLHRFLDLLHEFREEAQLIIVSHQKRTMEAADALYGVTMTPGGSSKVVSQKVRRATPDEERATAAS